MSQSRREMRMRMMRGRDEWGWGMERQSDRRKGFKCGPLKVSRPRPARFAAHSARAYVPEGQIHGMGPRMFQLAVRRSKCGDRGSGWTANIGGKGWNRTS